MQQGTAADAYRVKYMYEDRTLFIATIVTWLKTAIFFSIVECRSNRASVHQMFPVVPGYTSYASGIRTKRGNLSAAQLQVTLDTFPLARLPPSSPLLQTESARDMGAKIFS